MGLFAKDIKTMDDLFLHMLQDVYYAEQQIVKNLPTMAEKATNAELKAGFKKHLTESENHVKRLEQVFKDYGQQPKGVDCEAIDGILKEAKHVIGNVADKEVLDAALIACAQAVEHYEITRYGTMIAWAKQLGLTKLVKPLEDTLNEEYTTDKSLTALAEKKINKKAA